MSEQKQFGLGSIELTKFQESPQIQQVQNRRCIIMPIDGPNSRFFSEKDGRVYINFAWNEAQTQYSSHMIKPLSTKEEREAKVQLPIIGNLKEFKPSTQPSGWGTNNSGWGQPTAQNPAQNSGWGQPTQVQPDTSKTPSAALDKAMQQGITGQDKPFGGAQQNNEDLPF